MNVEVALRPVVPAPVVLGLLTLGGCMFGPYDGEIVTSSSSVVSAWGVYPVAGAEHGCIDCSCSR